MPDGGAAFQLCRQQVTDLIGDQRFTGVLWPEPGLIDGYKEFHDASLAQLSAP